MLIGGIYKSVKSIANGFGLPVQDIEDALSDAYVSVSNAVSAGNYQDSGKMFAYLNRASNNKIINILRVNKKKHESLDEVPERIEQEMFSGIMDIHKINELLVSSGYQELILRSQGYKYKDIAEELGKNLNTIKGNIFDQRRCFGRILQEQGFFQ